MISHTQRAGAAFLIAAAATFFLGASAHAADAPNKLIPPGGVALLPDDGIGAFSMPSDDTFKAQIVDASGQRFQKALRLTTIKQPEHTWDSQVISTAIAPIKKGDVCLAQFTMRVTQSGGGYGRANLIVENKTSYNKSLVFEASATGTWTTFYAPFTASEDEPLGDAHINFQIGFPSQTIEIADVHVTDYGASVAMKDLPTTPLTYDGHEANAPWRKAAASRIENIRKGNVIVKVLGANGRPISGASVRIEQTRHAFGFGTAADNIFIQDRPDSKQYRDLTYSLFNEVVIGNALKAPPWENGGWDSYKDRYSREEAIRFVQELRSHGMPVRGHNLVWPSWEFSRHWEKLKDDPKALASHILDHIKDEMGALKGQCFEWDVVNEPYNNHDVQDILGPHCIVDWYNAAHAADPSARLYLNDYGNIGDDNKHTDAFEAQVKYLLDNKAPLGGLGFQSHFSRFLLPPTKVYAAMDRFARFGLPLKVTEFDVNITDEQMKSDYLRDYMTIMFSHRSVAGFVMWGFWAGDHWLPDAAMYNKDFSINPNGKMYKDLVFHQWWTDKTGKSDRKGTFAARAFLGDYKIMVTSGGKTVTKSAHITKNGNDISAITIKLPADK